MGFKVASEQQDGDQGIAVYYDGFRAWEMCDMLNPDEVLQSIIRLARTLSNMRNSARFG